MDDDVFKVHGLGSDPVEVHRVVCKLLGLMGQLDCPKCEQFFPALMPYTTPDGTALIPRSCCPHGAFTTWLAFESAWLQILPEERPEFPLRLGLYISNQPGLSEDKEFEFRLTVIDELRSELKGYMCRHDESDTKVEIWPNYVEDMCILDVKACCGEFERCVRMFVREYLDVRINGKQTA